MVMLVVTGCSGGMSQQESSKSNEAADYDTAEFNSSDSEGEESSSGGALTNNDVSGNEKSAVISTQLPNINQMIIYRAEISIEVKDFNETKDKIQQLIIEKGGYIATSNSQQIHEGLLEGSLSARIPQEHFHQFLDEVEALSIKVHHQSVEGMDVTEEYVDLNSRLKSKETVEQRLLHFMQKAEKTEDLLKISADLGSVQEEIEQIKGRIKYLQNQIDLSTIQVSITENKVIVPAMSNEDLNTWEKTKKQFVTSIQVLASLFSGVVVFLIGNSPLLVISVIIIGGILFIIRRNKKKKLPNDI
jgi:hypothetical protein